MNKPSLREIQQAFASSIFGDGGAASELLETHQRRFKVYRTSVLENYRQALSSIFPVTSRLVGEQFFSQAATQFAHKNESTSGDLNQYGDAFPAFLEAYQPARDLAYLPDVARLEWRWHETFHATDPQPLDLEKLATVRPDDYGRLIFDLQAGYRSLHTPYPVDRIWQVNQPEHADPELVHLDSQPRWLVIYRFDFEVRIANVSRGMHALTQALAGKQQLSDATDDALAAEPELDVGTAVQWLAGEQIISGFNLAGASPAGNTAGDSGKPGEKHPE
jgi:hypothetical protein